MIETSARPQRTTADGRSYVLRSARPTDARSLAALFAAVRAEGRWLVTPASAISQPSESLWVAEAIRSPRTIALVAEADGALVGNVLITVDQSTIADHLGQLSICVADGWREVGVGTQLIDAALDAARERGLRKVALGVFPDNERAITVYERAGFVREGLRRRQYRGARDTFRDELLMAWFPDEAADAPTHTGEVE